MIAGLHCAAVTHKTARLALREKLARAATDTATMLRRTQLLTGECAVLSTCGRFEIYWIETGPVTPVTLLAQVTGLAKRILTPAVCAQSEGAAARHLLRVAAGLESPLMGEAHVLGQVRTALLIGQSAGAVGPVLSALFRAAIHTGRRVRSEAGLTRLGRDYTQLAVSEALRTIRPGGRALVIGAGSLGCAVARALAGHGVLVSVISRHAGRAQTLAAQVCGRAWDFDDLDQAVRASDVIVACTSAPQPMLTAARLAGLPARVLVLDFGMPRNVEPSARRLPNVELRALTELTGTSGLPPAMVRAAEAIILDEQGRFERWLDARWAHAPAARQHAAAQEQVA